MPAIDVFRVGLSVIGISEPLTGPFRRKLIHRPMPLHFKPPSYRNWAAPLLVALLAGLLVFSAIDPAGDYPNLPAGPGLTVDETFNVQQGVRLVALLDAVGMGQLSLRDVFGEKEDLDPHKKIGYHLPDHPPLGRLWIGICHDLAYWLYPPPDHQTPFVTACARTAPAMAFALLVFLVGVVATKWYGPAAGTIAAVALVLMPRLFGHAHLASLETFIGLTFTAAALSVAAYWSGPKPPGWRTTCLTGCLFGLALLTKMQAVLLPVPIVACALFRWRAKAIVPLCLWGGVGFVVFFVGWPWLWLDPVGHLQQYFGQTTDRGMLYVWYFSRKYPDFEAPWHYPFVMFLTTVPVGLHLLGFCGLFSGKPPAWKEPREQILLGCAVFPLLLFSWPGIAVYDGTRLFLVSFPLWAMLMGRGSTAVWTRIRHRLSHRMATLVLALFVAAQGYGLVAMHPCYLSYYNLLVGGLRGANWLGLEPTYWGDSLTRSFLEETASLVPLGAAIDVIPQLHQFQLGEMLKQSPILRRRRISLRSFEEDRAQRPHFVLIFLRKADLPNMLRTPPPNAKQLAEVRRDGVLLAALYEFE